MTTTSKLLQVIADFRKRLLDQEEQAQAELERAHANTLATIKPALDKLYDEMMEYLERGKKIPIRFLYEANRLEVIKLLISGQIDQYAALAHSTTLHMQNVGVQLGKQSALEQLEVVVPPQILDLLRQAGIKGAFGVPSLEAINQLIGATQKGSPLATLFQRWGAHAADRIAQTLITGITLGNNPRVVARHVRRIMEEQADTALGDSRNRALVISRTELNRAARNASLATMRENSDIITKYRRTCAKNSRTCVACIALDGKLYDLDKAFAIHPNCFPAGTIVSGPRIVGSTKRLYTGDLIEVETSFGNFLSVTPNHPILTPNGWIKAGELMEGDHVFSTINRERPFTSIDPNEYQIPSLIEEVVESFTSSGNMTTIGMPTTAKDFHGDGTDSQICIIRTNSQLRSRLQPQFLQPLRDLHFNRGHIVGPFLFCACSLTQFLKRTLGPSDGIVGWLSLPASLFRRHPGSFDCVGLARCSQIHPKSFQSYTDDCSVCVERLSESVFGFPIEIALRQFFVRYRELYLSLRESFYGLLRPPFSAFGLKSNSSAFNGISYGDIAILQPSFELDLPDVVFSSQGCESFTNLVSLDSSIKPIGERLGNTLSDLSNSSSISNNDSFEGASIGMEDTSKLVHSLARSVQRDQIIRIRKRTFHGYVYNLQTELGWYSANGIITHNCRCTTVPVTKSWSELLGPYGIDTSSIPDTRPQIETGESWFKGEPEDVQRKIIGTRRGYELYKAGKVTLQDFVTHRHSDDWGESIGVTPLRELVRQ